MNKPFKIIISVVGIIMLSVIAIFAGSALLYSIPAQPLSEATFGGVSEYTGSLLDQKLFEQMKNICHQNHCNKFAYNEISPPETSFYISFYVDSNNQIDIEKYKNGAAYISLFQTKISPPTQKTFKILHDLEKIGFTLNYEGGEKWLCNGKKLNKKNCIRTVQDVEPTKLIEFLNKEYETTM